MKLIIFFSLVAFGAIPASACLEHGKRLIKTSVNNPGVWLDSEEILELVRSQTGFMDVTDFDYSKIQPHVASINAIPTTLKYNETVRQAFSSLNTGRGQQFLRTLTEFHTRYYNSTTGRSSQLWLYTEVDASVRNYTGNASVFEVDHGYPQRSVVARLVGSDPVLRDEVVVIGAHLDSINGAGVELRAPGADDNGAGCVAVLEALRGIVDTGVVLKRTTEFHFYAAEEIGLKGSQAIAVDYAARNVNVVGMLNFDVISHHAENVSDIAIITDFGDADMAQFVHLLTGGYLDFGIRERTCGYGCSDHASFNATGFPATMAIEAVSNSPLHHTENDTFETVNWTNLAEFIKLAISFIIEFGEPAMTA